MAPDQAAHFLTSNHPSRSHLSPDSMSQLYRSAIGARMAKLPDNSPEDEANEENDELADSLGLLPSAMCPPAL